jgi:hypothetical protein
MRLLRVELIERHGRRQRMAASEAQTVESRE